MNAVKKQRLRVIYYVLSWLIVSLGHPSYFPLVCFLSGAGYGLFWLSQLGLSKKRMCISTFAWFFTIQLFHLSWMRSDLYQGIYTHILYVIIAVSLSILFMIMTTIGLRSHSLSKKRSVYFCFYMAALGIILELVRLLPFNGFTWNPLALPLASHLYSAQLASFGGVFFLSYLLLITNAFLLLAAIRKSLILACVWGLLSSFPYIYGYFRVESHQGKAGTYLSALIIETNLYPYVGAHEKQLAPWERWELILNSLAPYQNKSFDLILLPEGVIPFSYNESFYPSDWAQSICTHYLDAGAAFMESQMSTRAKVSNKYFISWISRAMHAPVIAGTDYTDKKFKSLNAAVYLDDQNERFYGKRSLLPMAEKIPFDFLKPLAKIYGIEDSYVAGDGAQVFPGAVKISPSICYEESQHSLMREGRVKGAKLFVNLTNDIWYPNSSLGSEHFIFSRLRAIENGIPLIRSCNAGISGGVDCIGKVIGSSFLPFDKEDVRAFPLIVPIKEISTAYSKYGDFWLWGFAFLIVIFERISFKRCKCLAKGGG